MSERVAAPAPSGSAEQLGELCGMPVRLTMLDPATKERTQRVAGVLVGVGTARWSIDCLHAVSRAADGSPVTVEVLMAGNLVWCHTVLAPGNDVGRNRVHLEAPTAVQTLQRRRHPRVDMKVPVHLILKREAGTFSATLRDLSAGGAAVWTSEPVTAGEHVQLVFSLGSGLYFQDLEAEVVRCIDAPEGSYMLALRFLCGKEQEAALAAWVNRQLAEGT